MDFAFEAVESVVLEDPFLDINSVAVPQLPELLTSSGDDDDDQPPSRLPPSHK